LANTGDTIPAGGGMGFKLELTADNTTNLSSTAYVVIRTNVSSNMVYAIKPIVFPTNVKNVELKNISLYPSPATSTLNVVHNSTQVSKAVVFNVIGKKIATYNTPYAEKGFSIPVAELSNGIYFIELQDKSGAKLALRKFSKN
jgi:hypothetical protein